MKNKRTPMGNTSTNINDKGITTKILIFAALAALILGFILTK